MKYLLLIGLFLIPFASYSMEKEKKKEENLKPYRKELPAILARENSPNTLKKELIENLTISFRELNTIEGNEAQKEKDENGLDEKALAKAALEQCNLEGDPFLNEIFAKRLLKMNESNSAEDKKTLNQVKSLVASKKGKRGIK
jgi:hypothetical protein